MSSLGSGTPTPLWISTGMIALSRSAINRKRSSCKTVRVPSSWLFTVAACLIHKSEKGEAYCSVG